MDCGQLGAERAASFRVSQAPWQESGVEIGASVLAEYRMLIFKNAPCDTMEAGG